MAHRLQRPLAFAFACFLLLTSLLVLPVGSSSASAADQGRDILARTGAFYASQAGLAADVVVNMEFASDSFPMGDMPPITYRYSFRAPDRIALIPPPGDMAPPVVQDGQRYYTEMPMMGFGILRDAFPLAALLAEEGSRYLQHPGARMIVGLGLDGRTPGSLRSMGHVELVGDEDVAGVDCWRLAIDDPEFEGDLWVAKGEEPWVLRIRQPAPEIEPADASGMMMISPGLDVRISNWDREPDFDGVFTIESDQDLELRDAMPTVEEMMAQAGPSGAPDGPHPSLNKPAPETTLHLLDGRDVALSDLQGKVVVLDFWATWCKPCVMALPSVARVTDELADRGVIFYAVNQRESASRVRSFLEERGLDVAVALDSDASASEAFGVGGIPHSVIIDRKGVVRKVHVGFGPGMDQELKKEIEALLGDQAEERRPFGE